MKFVFHLRQPFAKAMALCQTVVDGAEEHGDEIIPIHGFHGVRKDVDGLVLFGIGGESKQVWDAYREAGKKVIFIDKGYSRSPFLRVSVNEFQPLDFIKKGKCQDDRFNRLHTKLAICRPRGEHILFDGASNKYCLWEGLGDWVEWGQRVVDKIREHTDRPIIYRPRPSHNEPTAVRGAELSTGPLIDDLNRAAVVVSYGGNIGWDAVLLGLPHFALGNSCARQLSEVDWTRVGEPRIYSSYLQKAWANNVAYCQYTLDEFRSGVAWAHVKGCIK